MSLYFHNLYPAQVSVCVVLYDATCPQIPWRKAGWWNIDYGQTAEIWQGTLQTSQLSTNWYFFAGATDGAYWAGNPQVLVTDAVFDQCVVDNTGDTIQVGLRNVNIDGYDSYTVTLVGDSPWPTFRQNVERTGLSGVDTSGNAGQPRWVFNTQELVIFPSPVIGVDGAIYIRGTATLYTLNPDGTLRWTFPYQEGEGGPGSPTIGTDGAIYFTDHELYALNPDGTLRWSFPDPQNPPFGMASSPAIAADGTIYVGSAMGNMYALNPDGTVRWTFATDGEATFSPAIGTDGGIYIAAASHLYAVNPDGTLRWGYDLVSSYPNGYCIPAIGPDGAIYASGNTPAADAVFYAINADGTPRWNFVFAGSFYCTAAAIGGDGTDLCRRGQRSLRLQPRWHSAVELRDQRRWP